MLLAPLALAGAARLVALRPDLAFPEPGASATTTLSPLVPGIAWDEAIVSWNVENPANAAVKVEARAWRGETPTKWYVVADWASDAAKAPRVSVDGQKDADGTVDTDTLTLKRPADRLEVRTTLRDLGAGPVPRLRLLTASFLDSKAPVVPDKPERAEAWGKTIDVPMRAQGDYPNGGVLCSATSSSMLLWHYSKVL